MNTPPVTNHTINMMPDPLEGPASVAPIHAGKKVGRNTPCSCGSGKKAKNCCLKAAALKEQLGRVTQKVRLQQHFGVKVDPSDLAFIMLNSPEQIYCAAIRRKDGTVIGGEYHGQCFANAKADGLEPEPNCEQGFITTHNRFVDRYEGLAIAQAAKQIIHKHKPEDQLLSEDYRVVATPEQAVKEAREKIRLSAPTVEDAVLSPEVRASVNGA